MVLEGLLVFGGAMLISVFGHIIFHYTGIPESAFMILLGVLAGPILTVITPAGLEPVTPYLYTLSLLIVLLESGLSTHISEALKAMKTASIFTFLILISTTVICGGFLHFYWDGNYIRA